MQGVERSKNLNQWVAHVEQLPDAGAGGDPLEEARQWRRQSVYRVPAYIKNGSSYGPQMVSLGPFHHGAAELRPAEVHKERALLHLLRRGGADRRRRRLRLGSLVASMEEVVAELLEAYQGLDAAWRDDRDAFLKMMVLDGCFLLEVMRAAEAELDDYAANDPVFSRHGELYVFPYVRRDMLMIENQLPLLVLQMIVAFVHGGGGGGDATEATDDAINNMVLRFVTMIPDPPAMSGCGLALHPLDVCHRSLLHSSGSPPTRPSSRAGRREEFVPSATELDQAGVRFRPSRTRSLHDISFHRGELIIPRLPIDDTTEHKLFSLMAFEQLHASAGAGAGANEVTAFVFFMDNVIKRADDARLLGACGVVSNGLGSDKAVAEMYNRLANEVVLDRRSALHRVHREVNAYRERRWNQWRASLVQNHVGNPWAIISLAVAFVLLVLTVVQTVYTVLPYYHDQAASSSSSAGIAGQLLREL